jgi:1,4-dihydroxy-2-naphthoate octaprenyltransferase
VIRGASFVIAALIGGWLIARGGWPIASIGLGGLAVAIGYTAGPWPLAYHALGEAFVFLFFGPLAVLGTELLQTGRASSMGLLASLPVGLLATAILLVNNVRDVESDRRTGKRTLVVRLGRTAGQALYAGTVAAALSLAPRSRWRCRPWVPVAWLERAAGGRPDANGPALARRSGAERGSGRHRTPASAFGMLLCGGVVW